MMGWRARIGFLVPPGNPTVEPEMAELTPAGVSVHFTRMSASGPAGTHGGQEERNRSQLASLDEATRLLAMISPQVIVMAHTATSYTLGREAEAALVHRQESTLGTRFVTAFGCVLEALRCLGVGRIAYATPYDADLTEQGRAHLALHGFDVVGVARLEAVRNIYEETAERAYAVGRQADRPEAEAIFLSGTGMPTLAMLQALEDDLGKPVISAASAMMWNALRIANVRSPRRGYGRLLAGL
ncbi:maleate cis-trans isomerase family protein [Rhodopila sp.]|uniref:maleate cis-trans isomerase family protein n=1 Tax=Rhodopila sp. TaxID=2480087 RepID=UPI003D0B3615